MRPEALVRCLAAIAAFVAWIEANEPGTLLYTLSRHSDDPTPFMHVIAFADEVAGAVRHGSSAAVQRFTDVRCPAMLAPVEFRDYGLAAARQPR